MRHRHWIINICTSVIAMILLIAVLEAAMHVYHAVRKSFASTESIREDPLYIELDSPVLYGLNPEYPGISAQGLRDEEVSVPKPAGRLRILLLGDSITFGIHIRRGRIYPDLLEQLLSERYGEVDVINAGVCGYSTYNELQYYLTEGNKFEPDIVITCFCMNDIINPRIHWRFGKSITLAIPSEAIPNVEHDVNFAIPLLQEPEGRFNTLLAKSKLFNSVRRRCKLAIQKLTEPVIPTHLVLPDTTSIRVLLNDKSPEFRWLVSNFKRLKEVVTRDGARFMIVLFPLSYQLDEDYPFVPQKLLSRICERDDIPCLDLLPSFRMYRKEELFLLEGAGYEDIWHMGEEGHEVTARLIFDWLDRHLQQSDLK